MKICVPESKALKLRQTERKKCQGRRSSVRFTTKLRLKHNYDFIKYFGTLRAVTDCGLACFCLDEVFEMRFTMMSFWANVVQNIFQQFSAASLLFDTVINYSLELSQIYFFICFHHSFIVLIRSYRITSPASRQLKEFDIIKF